MKVKRQLSGALLLATVGAVPLNVSDVQVGSFGREEVKGVTEEIFENFKLYAQYSAAAYCKANSNSGDIKVALNTTQVVCSEDVCPLVQNDKAIKFFEFAPDNHLGLPDLRGFIAVDPTRKTTIVAFRGTSSLANIMADLHVAKIPLPALPSCPKCRVHVGFVKAFNERLGDTLKAVVHAQHTFPDNKIVFTGHSLGGAMATMMGAWFRARVKGLHNVEIWTFGAPRIGNYDWAKFVSDQPGITYRMTHLNDPIPRLPPSFWPFKYRHEGTEFWLGPDGSAKTDDYNATDIKICKGIEPKDCNGGARIVPINIKTHLHYLGPIAGCNSGKKRRDQRDSERMFAVNKDLETILKAEQGFADGKLTNHEAFEMINAKMQMSETDVSIYMAERDLYGSSWFPPVHKRGHSNDGKCIDCWLGNCPSDDKQCH